MTTPRLKLTSIRAIVPFKLVVTFSDGSSGTFDAGPMIGERGEGTEPLRDRRFFGSVELTNGVPTWPNHFDISIRKCPASTESTKKVYICQVDEFKT